MVMKILIIIFFLKLIKESKITRGHNYTLVKKQSRLDVRKYSFSQRTINVWNKLSTNCVHASIVRRKSHFKWNCCTDFFCQLILVHNGLRQHFPEGVQNFVQWHFLKSNMAATTSLNH